MQRFRARTPDPAAEAIAGWMARNPARAYLATVLFVPLFAFSVLFAEMWYNVLRLDRHGREVPAVVYDLDPAQHGGHLFVRYTVGGREYIGETGLGDAIQRVQDVRAGDTVLVTYLPSDPAVVQAGHRPTGTVREIAGATTGFALAAALFYFFPIYYLPTRRLRRQRVAASRQGPAAVPKTQ